MTDLAKLREAVMDDLACCIAMIQHAIGQNKDTFIEPDTKRKLSDARERLAILRALEGGDPSRASPPSS